MAIFYKVGTGLAKICFTAFAHWEVEGREAVPPKGPLIVVSNHMSNADSPMLVASLPRSLHFMAKANLFANPLTSSFLTSLGMHPVVRDRGDVGALKWNLKLLGQDQAIVLFP